MANADTQQQFLDMYAGQSAEMQQRMYNAGNAEVKAMIDAYNANQGNGGGGGGGNIGGGNGGGNGGGGNGGGGNGGSNYQYGYGSPEQEGALKPGTYAYYNNDNENRINEIVDNLNNYWKTTPQLFNNYDSFKKNFSYNARSDQQKKTLDDWRYGYNTSRQLSTQAIGDLANLYKNGQLNDADLNNLRAFYPDKYNEVMNKVNAQNDMNQYSEMLYGTEDTLDTSNVFNQLGNQFLNNLLNNSYSSNIDYFEQYQNELNSDEMRSWSDRLTDLQTEIDKIDTDLNTLYKDIEKRYEGLGASTAKIQAIYADEAYDLQIQRNSLALEQKSLATKYNSRLQEAQQNFSMRVQQHQLEMQERNQYMSELGFAMDLINFETNEEADERAWKNWTRQIDYQYGNIDSLDPVARKKAVDNSVSQILDQYDGIPMKRSKDQMVEDVLKLVDGGMSLGDALTQNIITPIQSKPEYQIRRNNKLGTSSIVTYGYDANGNPIITGGSATTPIGTSGTNYSTIDLGNGYSVSVNPNKTININGQEYRITQLGGETATSGIDFAPAVRGDKQEVQAFVGGKVIRSGEDSNSDVYGHGKNKYIEILGDDGYVYRYNHLNDWDTGFATGNGKGSVLNGTRVEAGTVLGHMGETGKAKGVHLDLAVYDGKRATDMSVSPLNIIDQARILFGNVNAMGLGIGSINTESTANGDWEDTYYAVQQQMIDKYGSQFMKSPDGVNLLDWAKRRVQAGWTGDEVMDSSRILTEDPVWHTNTGAYDAFERVFSKEYGTNQQKGYNFKDTVERWIGEGKYEKAFEYISDEGVDMFLTNDDKRTVTSTKEAVQGLTDIQQLYQDYIDAGGKGWKFTWAENGIKYDFLGADTGKAQEIRTKITLALNKFVKGMSGLTVSDRERRQYEQIFPKLGLTNKAFQGQIENLLSYFENDVNTIYGSALGAATYQDLQDWYKENMGDYYSIVGHYSGGIYHNYQSHGRIDITRNNPTGSGSNTVTPIGNFVLYGIK